jgi:hypothetical protein
LTREELYEAIECSADRKLYDTITNPPMQKYGYGMVHPLRALLTVSRGDPNNDKIYNIYDISYIIAYLYLDGPAPTPDILMGDVNCDGVVNVFDITYLVEWIYEEGSPPPVPCCEFND